VETVRCDLCGADEPEILFECRDRWFNLPGRFSMCRCRVCNLMYLNPRPERSEIGIYYPPTYALYLPAIEDEPSAWQRLNRRYALAKRIRLVRTAAGDHGTALDVGCATGIFLNALRHIGWNVCGVEIDGQAAAYARSRFGLSVFHGELIEAAFAEQQFDLITMWDVLEHVHQPRATLLEAAKITRPGGKLILSLPNPEGLEARLFGPLWAGWDCPRHLYMFTISVLRHMLAITGWRVEQVTGQSARMWLLLQSIRYWLEANTKQPWIRALIWSIISNEMVRAACIPYFALVEKLGISSGLVVIAKRDNSIHNWDYRNGTNWQVQPTGT
jgi:2-polyprenyl-3-methyl-5-hydroxy-6-metoxy-1,4-benzoquinol methylase